MEDKCFQLYQFSIINRIMLGSKIDFKLDIHDFEDKQAIMTRINSQGQKTSIRDNYINAIHPWSKEWMKAIVLSTRMSKDYNAMFPKTLESYEFYVNFADLDKMNDCWLPYSDIKQTEEAVVETNYSKICEQLKQKHYNDNPHFGLRADDLKQHEKITKIKKVEKIRLGIYQTHTWYYSPLPPQYNNIQILYFCQFCLSFYCSQNELIRHDKNCLLFHPPGDQIYRDQERNIAIFEVDGDKSTVYCQNLGYLSKMFLDHKSLKFQVNFFLFYVLCEIKDNEYHIAGYFSKCKQSAHNLSCILVLPFYQRKGFGKFLINFSYELSLVDGKEGSPEKPLSDLGRQTYRAYWSQTIIELILQLAPNTITIQKISKMTAISQEDIKWTLKKCNLLKLHGGELICLSDKQHLTKLSNKFGHGAIKIDRDKLHYVRYETNIKFWSILPKL